MASNRAQILISAVDQTKTAFDSIKRGLGGLTDTAKSVNGVLANLGVAVSVAGLTAMVKSASTRATRWMRCRSVSVSASKPCRCGNRQPSSPACRANRSRRGCASCPPRCWKPRPARKMPRAISRGGRGEFKNQDGTLRGHRSGAAGSGRALQGHARWRGKNRAGRATVRQVRSGADPVPESRARRHQRAVRRRCRRSACR
jgi:hypothetical protein